MHSALTSASFGASSMPCQSTLTSAACDEVAQGLEHAGAVDLVLAGAGDEIAREGLEVDAALAVGRRRGSSSSTRKRAMPTSVMR